MTQAFQGCYDRSPTVFVGASELVSSSVRQPPAPYLIALVTNYVHQGFELGRRDEDKNFSHSYIDLEPISDGLRNMDTGCVGVWVVIHCMAK